MNTEGSYNCECLTGYEGAVCEDKDECENQTVCGENADCSNLE